MVMRHRVKVDRTSAAEGRSGAGFSRRSLLKGAAAATAALGAVSLVGCGSDGGSDKVSGEPQVITDDSKITDVVEEYKNVDNALAAQFAWDIPLGTVPFHSEGAWAALLEAPSSARSINTLGIISLASGARTTLISEPTKGAAYGFHDVRCGETVYAWIEMNYATGDWASRGPRSSGRRCPSHPVPSAPSSHIATDGPAATRRRRSCSRAPGDLRHGRA